jgi:hypothetical protein
MARYLYRAIFICVSLIFIQNRSLKLIYGKTKKSFKE